MTVRTMDEALAEIGIVSTPWLRWTTRTDEPTWDAHEDGNEDAYGNGTEFVCAYALQYLFEDVAVDHESEEIRVWFGREKPANGISVPIWFGWREETLLERTRLHLRWTAREEFGKDGIVPDYLYGALEGVLSGIVDPDDQSEASTTLLWLWIERREIEG